MQSCILGICSLIYGIHWWHWSWFTMQISLVISMSAHWLPLSRTNLWQLILRWGLYLLGTSNTFQQPQRAQYYLFCMVSPQLDDMTGCSEEPPFPEILTVILTNLDWDELHSYGPILLSTITHTGKYYQLKLPFSLANNTHYSLVIVTNNSQGTSVSPALSISQLKPRSSNLL